MTKRELSKYDFDIIERVFEYALDADTLYYKDKIEQLKDLFAKAHTGWLEIEED